MDCVHPTESIAPLPSLPYALTLLPSVVAWYLVIEQGLGKVIMLTELEEGCQLGVLVVCNYLGSICTGEVDPLAILQVNTERDNRGLPLMYREFEKMPHSLVSAGIPAVLKLTHLILCALLHEGIYGSIRSFVDILANVLDAFY